MIFQIASDATAAINWSDLHLSPIALDLGFFKLRWYSIAYISGILIGWWYLLKLLAQAGAPMARRHADDLVFYVTLGIILGGRIGYILFYKPEMIATPFEMLKLWEGGMSLHGGFLGVILALLYFTHKHKLNMIRVCDYVACVTPFGLFFGRLANFVNGELWGRPTTVPWGIIFPGTGDGIARHPSQLYEASLEGIVLFAILNLMFWKTDARYQPGKLVGTGLVGYGIARTLLETVRQPDAGLEHLWWGLTMGQTLSIPMILVGIYLVATAKTRRVRIEGTAGLASVA
ncbi:MAG: prolipoprotein diacylglyceryl transferase [Sphingomonadales bacterium]|nr:prolipoprotein diacylglyceryl transferase [Sphingomonadales bacterium]